MLKKIEELDTLYKNINEGLELARTGFLKTLEIDDQDEIQSEDTIRSVSDAKIILDLLHKTLKLLVPFFEKYPSLEELFLKEYGNLGDWTVREIILETIFLDEFLFQANQSCEIETSGQFNKDFLDSYYINFETWKDSKEGNHLATQEVVKNQFSLKLHSSQLTCQCFSCLGDYRTKTREFIYRELVEQINTTEEKINEIIEKDLSTSITDTIGDLKKRIEKDLHQNRYKLKRASLSKLDAEIKSIFKDKFSYKSLVGLKYLEKLKPRFVLWLREQNLRSDLVGELEYERFFQQLDIGIWKHENLLKKDFQKLVQTVMALKRKDISAAILMEYLGQFWLHSEARKINRTITYHMGPTNSGKTYHAVEALVQARKGCYLAPLRLLASELYDTMNAKGAKTTLLTGEEVIEVEGATHYSSTIEMAKLNETFDCCVIDEIQMMSDTQRGWAWTRALVNIKSPDIHICGDNSVHDLVKQICELTGDILVVKQYERKTKLQIEERPIVLGALQRSDALIVFSRRNALKYKADLENLNYKVSIVYGMLSPEVRREQARKFDQGETDIIVSTDAIAMGMNLPVQRIVFSAFSKFIDNKEYHLTNSEIKQIAGRAGRFGRFPTGFVTCLSKEQEGISTLKRALSSDLVQSVRAMVGPDLDIFNKVNNALKHNSLPILSLSEFLRLFNTMTFTKPFYCVELKEMIELAEMVEQADEKTKSLNASEIFGFACAPVNLGLMEHVQYYVWILNNYVQVTPIHNEEIDANSDNIDYLETAIKCIELYQWLSRHFDKKNFEFNEVQLLHNKSLAVERLNELLSEKTVRTCTSCAAQLPPTSEFNICEKCFENRKFQRRPSRPSPRGAQASRPGNSGRSAREVFENKNKSHQKSHGKKNKFRR